MNIRLYRIGAWLWVVTGLVHNATDLLSRLFPVASKEPLRVALRALTFEMLGMRNSYYELTMGFSLAMGTGIAVAGILFLLIARLSAHAPPQARPAGWVGVVASGVLLALSVTVLRLPPPIVTFALASLAFAAALFVSRASASAAVG